MATPFRIGPGQTPRAVQILVFLFLGVAVASGFVSHLFGQYMGLYTPERLLSLSLWGIEQFFLWQFLTYPLVAPVVVSFFFALYLLFMAYLIWMVGTSLVGQVGRNPFLRLAILTTLIGGLCGFGVMALLDGGVLIGPTTPLYGLLIAWTMFFPELQLLFLGTFPIRMKWLIPILLGLNFLTDLTRGDFVQVVAYLGSALTGYLYTLIAWNRHGPFGPFDEWVADLGVRWRSRRHRSNAKVVDFRTGKAVREKDTSKRHEP